MPVNPHKDKKGRSRWRFSFNRIIHRERVRATKLLPKAWGRAEAEKYDRDETARLYGLATGVLKSEPLIDEAVALYLDERCKKLRNGKKVAKDLAHVVPYFEGRPISQFPDVAADYVADNPHLADGTLHNRLAYLKAAGRYAWKRRRQVFGPADPTTGMVIPRSTNTNVIQLPVERVRNLLAAIDDMETKAIFTLAFRVASRWVKGIHARQPEDIIHQGRDVWLNVGITKNGTPRMKWVHPDARWALAYIPFKLRPETYSRRFRVARAKVGLDLMPITQKGFTAHNMRHVVATDIRRRGGSLFDVQTALDNDSYQSVERYAFITPEQVKRVLSGVGAAKKMHTRGRRRRTRATA